MSVQVKRINLIELAWFNEIYTISLQSIEPKKFR